VFGSVVATFTVRLAINFRKFLVSSHNLLACSTCRGKRVDGPKRRGQTAKAQSGAGLPELICATSRLWRKHHLSYDQSKYGVERARCTVLHEPPRIRRRTVERLDYLEISVTPSEVTWHQCSHDRGTPTDS
jgi:hypothetical protein